MRFVVYGAGAIGGVVGARLFQAGREVALIARGDHYAAIRRQGLVLESPGETATLPIAAVERPGQLRWLPGDVVLLAVKSQDTVPAVCALAEAAPTEMPIICMQNGVENERASLRRFPDVYGVAVMCPAAHLRPGVVRAYSVPTTGILDLGRWPRGADDTARAVAAAFTAATFSSSAVPDIRRWKYAKLLTNLGNAVEAVCGPAARRGPIGDLARREGEVCLRAAGIDCATAEEDARRRGHLLDLQPIGGQPRGGGSSWQSLMRGAGGIETDYLNGEIVLLGRLHGVPTPVNALLCRLANQLAATGSAPGTISPEEFLRRLRQSAARE